MGNIELDAEHLELELLRMVMNEHLHDMTNPKTAVTTLLLHLIDDVLPPVIAH